MGVFGCCTFLITIIAILVGIGYVQQDLIFEFAIDTSISAFYRGILCVQMPSGEIKKFGDSALISDPNFKCSVTMEILDSKAFYREMALNGGQIGLGETYMNGYWRVPGNSENIHALSDLIYHVMNNELNRVKGFDYLLEYVFSIKHHYEVSRRTGLTKLEDEDEANIMAHYDIGNDFYSTFLSEKMNGYTCGFFEGDEPVEQAQDNKWQTVINKIGITAEHNVLDIGSGWGYFCSYANNRTGARCTGITISAAQVDHSKNAYRQQISDGKLEYHRIDYRDIYELPGYAQQYDRIVSVGILEHVGFVNLDQYFRLAYEGLKPGGYFLLHYITQTDVHNNSPIPTREKACFEDANFIWKYIFPNGCLLHPDWVWERANHAGFELLHNEFYGMHYARTLHEWRRNFRNNWPALMDRIKKQKTSKGGSKNYDERLYKMFEFYFAYCEAIFRNGRSDLVQMILYKPLEVQVDKNGYSPHWNAEKVTIIPHKTK